MKWFIHLKSGQTVGIEEDPMDGFYAIVPSLPGCGSQGDSLEEALEDVNDAIMAVLSVLKQDDPERYQQICSGNMAYSVSDIEVNSTAPLTSLV